MVGNRSIDSNGLIKNVQLETNVYAVQKNSNCATSFKISGSADDSLVVDKQTKDEILLLPLLNSEERNKYYGISSEDVTIEMILTFTGIEPTLIVNNNDQCSINDFGSIQVEPSIEGLEYQANLIYNGKEEMFTSKLDNVKPGEYVIENYGITTDYCRRSFTQLSVDIGISIFSLNISSNPCQSVIITPSILNSSYSSDLLYNYNITTPSNLSMQFIKSGINQCQLDNGDGSTNMGLAVGLPIGLVAAGATAAGVFFYKKRVGPIKTKELLPEEHEMETVTTFQGGHFV
ncbi:hypothetical protein ACTFIY_002143 [Dictyostelium cf. discoideum]